MSQLQSSPATPSPLRLQNAPHTHASQSPLLDRTAQREEPPTPTPITGAQTAITDSPVPIPFPRLSTEQYPSGYPRRRTNDASSYWGPPPPTPPAAARSYDGNNYELQRRAPEYNNNYPQEYDGYYNYGDMQPLNAPNDYSVQGYDSPQQHRSRRPSFPVKPRHQKSGSLRNLRFDPKRRSYHFDTLSDIDSEGFDRRPSPSTREGSKPAPEEILRLPLTWWMNSDAKNRTCCSLLNKIFDCFLPPASKRTACSSSLDW